MNSVRTTNQKHTKVLVGCVRGHFFALDENPSHVWKLLTYRIVTYCISCTRETVFLLKKRYFSKNSKLDLSKEKKYLLRASTHGILHSQPELYSVLLRRAAQKHYCLQMGITCSAINSVHISRTFEGSFTDLQSSHL